MALKHSEGAVFISGATSGLGLETAKHFVKIGKQVVFCGRNTELVEATLKHLKSFGLKNQLIMGYSNDVSNRESTTKMIEKLSNLGIKVDVLICNAGQIGPIDRFLENKLEDWEEAFNVNLYGTINLIREILPSMILRKKGKVIHISGGGATSPLLGMSSYAASKAAAVRLIETVALEYEDSGVAFHSIAPGMLKTKLLEQMLDAGPDRIGGNFFAKTFAKAESPSDSTLQAIDLIHFLASEASVGITGKLISAEWDNWAQWPSHLSEIKTLDLYTLRRITGRDRGQTWGDL
jgi:NADP-dependent 3-hydroxy acid dehydrogenase YdfG